MNNFFIVNVALDVPVSTQFSYLFEMQIPVGTRVVVPFRRSHKTGIVLSLKAEDDANHIDLRKVERVFDELPPLPKSFLNLIQFCADYYHYPVGQTLFSALPLLLRQAKPVHLRDDRLWQLNHSGLSQQAPTGRYIRRLPLWNALSMHPVSTDSVKQFSAQAIKWCQEWETAGWVDRPREVSSLIIESGPVLNKEQERVISEVIAERYRPYLLHGITGSGKTEIYLNLIADVLKRGKQALVLVPEISLTPQLLQRFKVRFPATQFSILHSNIGDGERLHGWINAWQGHSRIVIGTRLAVFTPLPDLGLIIVDEEHDQSFKQQDELRYHARDVAVWRARQADIPIVLGSATPSLESLANVKMGRYKLLSLPYRAAKGARLPDICLIDIRREKLQEGVCATVLSAISSILSKQQQVLVYINRRGFAPVLSCPACGWVSGCPHCSARLVLHLNLRRLSCHHCGYSESVTVHCPDCGNPDLQPLGQGTQRVEETLVQRFSQARILRVDRDSMGSRHAWDDVHQKMYQRQVDILIGTQMLAKGHDFPSVALVVILNADGGLYSADFRAAEHLFAQLIQVSGRAGRADIPGRVMIQTQWPEHPLYQYLQHHNFNGFVSAQLAERNEAGFPPYVYQAMLRADSDKLDRSIQFLKEVKYLVSVPDGVKISGPAPALMVRLARRERAQLVVESTSRPALHVFLTLWLEEIRHIHPQFRTVRWSIDVDPQEC